MLKILLIPLSILVINFSLLSDTWDEPWHEEVIKESDTFAKVRIISVDKENGVKVELIKNIAGKEIPSSIYVNSYHKFGDNHNHYHYHDPNLEEGSEYYVFLKKGKDNNYLLPTPSSGTAYIDGENVIATYRHSYHKAIVPIEIYENTMRNIFTKLKGIESNYSYTNDLIKKYLLLEPSTPIGKEQDSEEARRFFIQHVVLECVYFLADEDYINYFDRLILFLSFKFYHTQISAIRALSIFKDEKSKAVILDFLKSENDNFAKVMAVWALEKMNAVELITELKLLYKTASEEEVYFETNIMDPRVGTYFPNSVKDAIGILLKKWS